MRVRRAAKILFTASTLLTAVRALYPQLHLPTAAFAQSSTQHVTRSEDPEKSNQHKRAALRTFSEAQYEEMRDDKLRTEAYYSAIDVMAPGKFVLDLGTGALALLAIRAGRAKAAHVWAIEASQSAAQSAREEIEKNGLSSKVTVIEGRSEDIILPQRVDLVIHELFGEIASREGVATIMRDAANRHVSRRALEHGDWSVPQAASTLILPAELNMPQMGTQGLPLCPQNDRGHTLILAPPKKKDEPQLLRLSQISVPQCGLSEPTVLEELKFCRHCLEVVLSL